jgi:hypothetical protein
MDTSTSVAGENIILDPTRLQRTIQSKGGTTVLSDSKYFLRIPEAKIQNVETFVGRQVEVKAEQLPKGSDGRLPKLVDIEITREEFEKVRENPKLAPYLRVVHPTETQNDKQIALAMMNSAAAREMGAMQALGLGPDQVIRKYTQFVGTLGDSFNSVAKSILDNLNTFPDDLAALNEAKTEVGTARLKVAEDKVQAIQDKFQLMDTIIGSLLRLVPGGSIGSLSNGEEKGDPDQIAILKGAQNKLQEVKKQIEGFGNRVLPLEERQNRINDLMGKLEIISKAKVDSAVKTIVGGGEKASTVKSLGSKNSLLQDFRIIQFIATGVELLAKLKNQGSAEATQLYNALNQGPLGAYGSDLDFIKTIQQSGFFMEYSYKELDAKIAETFANRVASALPEGLDDAQKGTIKAAVENKLKKLREATGDPDKIKGGFRGRDVSSQIDGCQRPHKQVFPKQGPAEIRGEPVKDRLTTSQDFPLTPEAQNFFRAVRHDGGFTRPFRPQQSATPDVIDPQRVAMLNEPVKFLQNALKEAGQDIDIPQLEEQKAALQNALLDTKFNDESGFIVSVREGKSWEIKDLVEQNATLDQYTSKPSFAASMIDHGLQTFCSISGTTTDIVGGLVAQKGGDSDGKTAMANILGPLVQLAEAKPIDLAKLAEPKFDSFKNLFLSVALYMQSGQYHTASEVLAGLYCAALNVCPANNPSHPPATDMQAFGERFEKLCVAFQSNPAAFFPAPLQPRAA